MYRRWKMGSFRKMHPRRDRSGRRQQSAATDAETFSGWCAYLAELPAWTDFKGWIESGLLGYLSHRGRWQGAGLSAGLRYGSRLARRYHRAGREAGAPVPGWNLTTAMGTARPHSNAAAAPLISEVLEQRQIRCERSSRGSSLWYKAGRRVRTVPDWFHRRLPIPASRFRVVVLFPHGADTCFAAPSLGGQRSDTNWKRPCQRPQLESKIF